MTSSRTSKEAVIEDCGNFERCESVVNLMAVRLASIVGHFQLSCRHPRIRASLKSEFVSLAQLSITQRLQRLDAGSDPSLYRFLARWRVK